MTFKRSINKEDINYLPLFDHPGEAILIETDQGVIRAVKELQEASIVGFDTETRPCFVRGESYKVSMLQLATEERAYLFRLNKVSFLPELVEILASPKITKVGLAIIDDIKGLQKIAPFTPGGFVELQTLAKKNGIENLSLRALTAIFLDARLSKAAKITNWERTHLTPAQISYAANDAFVGLKIYQRMMELGLT